VLTDPVYGRIAPGSTVLYAHLGGQPALNGYAGAFI
jgi:1-aminocyclopropane-1-carboxylate deaminase